MTNHLHVKRLYLKNIRCYSEIELILNKSSQSIVIVGDNGQGKSTLLRSLAMGLCDQSSASALFRELPGEYVRHGSDEDGIIEVDLAGAGSYSYKIRTIIRSLDTFERVEQELYRIHGNTETSLSQDDFPWERIFASGYGAGIRVEGTADYNYYLTVDAVYSLFRYDVQLHNPELIMRRLTTHRVSSRKGAPSNTIALSSLKSLLEGMLDLEKSDKIVLSSTGLKIQGEWGCSDLGSAGDGYRATVTWILDLLAWWYLKALQENVRARPEDLRGIVLIDEIEQHLHPRWQRNVVGKLLKSFPGVQLIATTHSPVVVSGCDGIEVYRVAGGSHQIENPYGWLAEDVYRWMGLRSTRAASYRNDIIQEYSKLDRKRLHGNISSADLAKLRALKNRLQRLPENDPVRVMEEIANIRRELES